MFMLLLHNFDNNSWASRTAQIIFLQDGGEGYFAYYRDSIVKPALPCLWYPTFSFPPVAFLNNLEFQIC